VVHDTGPGVAPELASRVFDPYFTTKEVGKGSGLGLSVVHGIVKTHGGAVLLDSSPAKGTTITLYLPTFPAERTSVLSEKTGIPGGSEIIFFVDDEPSIVQMSRIMLQRLGYSVEAWTDPTETLALFKEDPFACDLIITDMTMPQMNGVRLSQAVKAVRPDIPVIICTGNSPYIDEDRAAELGIAACVMKPMVKSEIAQVIREVLDSRRAE
jgi:CheY-like chemotaxis protein